MLIWRSAAGVRGTEVVALSFVASPSMTPAGTATVTVFTSVPVTPAAMVAVTVKVACRRLQRHGRRDAAGARRRGARRSRVRRAGPGGRDQPRRQQIGHGDIGDVAGTVVGHDDRVAGCLPGNRRSGERLCHADVGDDLRGDGHARRVVGGIGVGLIARRNAGRVGQRARLRDAYGQCEHGARRRPREPTVQMPVVGSYAPSGAAETNVIPGGSTSLTVTPVAGLGPWLTTTMLKVNASPTDRSRRVWVLRIRQIRRGRRVERHAGAVVRRVGVGLGLLRLLRPG